jgi:hypothetical protein
MARQPGQQKLRSTLSIVARHVTPSGFGAPQ